MTDGLTYCAAKAKSKKAKGKAKADVETAIPQPDEHRGEEQTAHGSQT